MEKMLTMHIAEPADAPALAELAAKTFFDTYAAFNTAEDMDHYITNHFNVSKIEQEIAHPGTLLLIVRINGAMAGYAKLLEGHVPDVPENAALEISRFYVDRPFQSKGIGRRLMAEIWAIAESSGCTAVWLGVWQRNQRAIEIYTRLGFRITGTTTFQLGSDLQEDFVMIKYL